MTHAIALALVTVGCVVIAASTLGAATVRGDLFVRLHFLTPVTTIGVPLLSVGLCVESGNGWIIAEVLLIMAMLFVAGPMLEAATARAAAQRRGLIDSEQPE